MRNNGRLSKLFGIAAIVCVIGAFNGLGQLSASAISGQGQFNIRGILLLGGSVIIGLPITITYYYYRGRAREAGKLEYKTLEILAASQRISPPKPESQLPNTTQKGYGNKVK